MRLVTRSSRQQTSVYFTASDDWLIYKVQRQFNNTKSSPGPPTDCLMSIFAGANQNIRMVVVQSESRSESTTPIRFWAHQIC